MYCASRRALPLTPETPVKKKKKKKAASLVYFLSDPAVYDAGVQNH